MQLTSRAGIVLVVITFVVILTPLAYADPPDPTWVVGIFDDDDFDEVVGLIISTTALADVSVARCLGPVVILVILRGPPSEDPVLFVRLSVSGPRAPPSV
jgi:hypothetical protein